MEELELEALENVAGGFEIDKNKIDLLKKQGKLKISGLNIQVKCPECNNGWINVSLINRSGTCSNCKRYFDKSSVDKYKSKFGF